MATTLAITDAQMRTIFFSILGEIDRLEALKSASTNGDQIDNLRVEIGKATEAMLVFKKLWREAELATD